MWTSALVAAMAIAPTLVSAAVFPKGGLVKEIDAKGFTKVMKGNVSIHPLSILEIMLLTLDITTSVHPSSPSSRPGAV
jgi:hypothetical protein